MADTKNLNFDLVEIAKYFELNYNESRELLNDWLQAEYVLDEFDTRVINDLYDDIVDTGEYMNEEELKAKMVSFVFYAAKIQEHKKIRVFYERAMSGVVNNMPLSVVCDCLIATPRINAPDIPYFFLQEFKKAKGEKKDPEAQMLIAMLIAQQKNNDNKPIFGGYLLGTGWHFTTLVGKDYCISRRFEATEKHNLLKIVYILRRLKEFILQR